MAQTKTVEPVIAAKVNEIRAQPYARLIQSEDVIERNFGYKIIRQQVSAGRNSVVYRCESVKFPELYVLVKAYKMGAQKVKLSLKEEVCQIMRFVSGKCPSVLSVYDMMYTNEKFYIMCDWSSKGEVLNNMKQRTFRLNEEMLHNWTLDLLSAVNFLHGNAICHRNIAPNCLLLTNDMRVKIGTLGDACIYCNCDGSLIKQKWPKFSRLANWNQAPEVAKGKPYDPRRADIWSIGATVYWFITRMHPIDYRSSSKMTKQLDHKLMLMRKVSSRCQAFVRKMLTFQPASRPTIVQAMQLEWVSMAPPETSQAKETPASDLPPPQTQDPGEAAGPEETPTEPEQSHSRSQPAASSAAPSEPSADQQPPQG